VSFTVSQIGTLTFESTTDWEESFTISEAVNIGDLIVCVVASENPAANSQWIYAASDTFGFFQKPVDTVNTNAGNYDLRFSIEWKQMTAALSTGDSLTLRFSTAANWAVGGSNINKRLVVAYRVQPNSGAGFFQGATASAINSSKSKLPNSGASATLTTASDDGSTIVFGGAAMEHQGIPSSYAQDTADGWPADPQYDAEFTGGLSAANISLAASYHQTTYAGGSPGTVIYDASWGTGRISAFWAAGVVAFHENQLNFSCASTTTATATAALEVQPTGLSTASSTVGADAIAETTVAGASASAGTTAAQVEASLVSTATSAGLIHDPVFQIGATSSATSSSTATGPELSPGGIASISGLALAHPAGITPASASASQVTSAGVSAAHLLTSALSAITAHGTTAPAQSSVSSGLSSAQSTATTAAAVCGEGQGSSIASSTATAQIEGALLSASTAASLTTAQLDSVGLSAASSTALVDLSAVLGLVSSVASSDAAACLEPTAHGASTALGAATPETSTTVEPKRKSTAADQPSRTNKVTDSRNISADPRGRGLVA